MWKYYKFAPLAPCLGDIPLVLSCEGREYIKIGDASPPPPPSPPPASPGSNKGMLELATAHYGTLKNPL